MMIQSVAQVRSVYRPRYLILLEILIANYDHYIKTKISNFEEYLIKIVQLASYFILGPILRRLYNIKVAYESELSSIEKNRYVIVANHKKVIDPYLIFAAASLSSYKTLLPIRSFTANIYLEHWWQRLLLIPYGCFRAHSTEGKLSGVKGGLQVSDRGHSLLIFPEGKRVRPNERVEPKIGVAYLAQRANFTIIPVHISYSNSSSFTKTNINWGKPFKVKPKMQAKDLESLARLIFKRVEALA